MTIQINPGAIGFHPSDRLLEELQILERLAHNIVVGSKTIEGVQYTALLIKGMALTAQNSKPPARREYGSRCDPWHSWRLY